MSQLSDVCSLEEESDYADSGGTHHSSSSLSRCNSSSSIVNSATQAEKSMEASLETAWTDSKHSSYLDLMEANFVKNMYGRSYCVEDVCGKKSDHDHIHDNQDAQVEEYDDDSAQSGLRMSLETMEFKMYDHGDWTWRPVSRSMLPAGVPWVLLKNPWLRHFRPKNSSTISLKAKASTSLSSVKDTVGSTPKKSSTINLNIIPSTFLSSRKDEAGRVDVLSRVTLSPKTIGCIEHHQRGHEIVSSSSPGSEKSKTKFATFGRGNDDLDASQMKDRIQQSFLDQTVVAGVTNPNKRILCTTYKQLPMSRQKTGNEVKGGSENDTCNQDDATPSNVILDSVTERLGELIEES
eukprot:c15990_g1_i1 orf=364-1413(-)